VCLPCGCTRLCDEADLVTQRRIADAGPGKRRAFVDDALAAIAAYARAWRCRQQLLCAHFLPDATDHIACGTCDACRDPERANAPPPPPRVSALGSAEQQL